MCNEASKVTTNTRIGSVQRQEHKVITFEELWANYPGKPPCINAKTGDPTYEDQCAIKVGVALYRCCVRLDSFRGATCDPGHKDPKHIIRAQELANWLDSRPFPGCPHPTKCTDNKSFAEELKGRRGIIFFKDYWRRTIKKDNGETVEEKSPTGDHIDLWNGTRLTALTSYFRAQWGIHWEGYWTDLGGAKEILLWKID